MKTKLLCMVLLVFALVFALASCKDKKNGDDERQESVEQTLSLEAFCDEIEAYKEATMNQPSFSYVPQYVGEDAPEKPYCTIYFDGSQSLIQYNPPRGTFWYGKVGNEYVEIDADEKTYTVMTKEEFESTLKGFRRNMMEDIIYLPDEMKKGTNFSCTKRITSDKITYLVKCTVEYEGVLGVVDYVIDIVVEDGVIVKYADPEVMGEIYTYPRDVVVTLPDLSDYTRE